MCESCERSVGEWEVRGERGGGRYKRQGGKGVEGVFYSDIKLPVNASLFDRFKGGNYCLECLDEVMGVTSEGYSTK